MLDEIRDSNGQFPKFAWPGGYPIVYIMSDGEILCADCANRKNGSIARVENGPTDSPSDGWRIEGYQVFYEGSPVSCCHCGAEIESAYGNPEKHPAIIEEGKHGYWWSCPCGRPDEGGPCETWEQAWDAIVKHERKNK